MKKIVLSLLVICLSMINLFASHNMGGDITYKWISGNQYEIQAILYVDCNSPSVNNVIIDANSVACNLSTMFTLTKISDTDITPICSSASTGCQGGPNAGVKKLVYSANVTMPQNCSDWVLSYNLCCRPVITNITNANMYNFYIETTLNNLTVNNNNSPYFVDEPRWYLDDNQLNIINGGAYDVDGDSLHFSLTDPKSNGSTNIPYTTPFTATQPLTSSPAVSIDAATGLINTSPTNNESTIMVVKVDEFRNGQLIGSVKREFLTFVLNGNANLPSASINTSNNINVCAGDTVNISAISNDLDLGDSVNIHFLNPISNVNFTTSNNGLYQNGDFYWVTNVNDIRNQPHVLYFNVQDNSCTYNKIQSYAISVTVDSCGLTNLPCAVNIPYDTVVACQSDTQLVALSASGLPATYSWFPAFGLNDSTIYNPTANKVHLQKYVVTLDEGNGCIATDSVIVSSYNWTVDTFYMCDDTTTLDFGPGAANYFWQYYQDLSGNTFNLSDTTQTINVYQEGDYMGYAFFPQCGALTSIFTVLDSCDLVWPGDADVDFIANNMDILPIGLHYNVIGPVRPNASSNWVGQSAPNWGTQMNNGADIMHVDCDGNGTIDVADINPILQNYGLTHAKGGNMLAGPNDPMLTPSISPDTTGVSTALSIPINFGTSSVPADSVYGLAFSVTYDPALIDSSAGITVDFNNSWLGAVGTDMITLDTNFYNDGRIDIGLVRTNGLNQTGFGGICTLNLITIDNLSGKQAYLYETLSLSITNVKIISNQEMIRPYNTDVDSVVIKMLDPNSIGEYNNNFTTSIYPNPSNGVIKIAASEDIIKISVLNSIGQQIQTSNPQAKETQLNLNELPKGVYFINIKTVKGMKVERVSLVR